MTKDEALKLALEALELSAVTVDSFGVQRKTQHAIAAMKEALAQPAQEPVGEMQLSGIIEGLVIPVVPVELPIGTKLYTTPPQRKPLTDAWIDTILIGLMRQHKSGAVTIVRAIEAAHGVKENT